MRGDGELAARKPYQVVNYLLSFDYGEEPSSDQREARRRSASRSTGLLTFSSSSSSSRFASIIVCKPHSLLVQDFGFTGQLVGVPEQVLQGFCGLFGLAGADYWHGRRYDSGRQPAEGLAGQGVHYGRRSGRAVGEELVQVLTDKVQVIECDGQIMSFRRVVYHQFSADVDILPCVLGQSLVAEALSAGGGQDVGRWLVLAFRFYRFGRNKALVDEGVDPVLVLPGGDSGGSVEEFGVASGTGDLGGGGGGLLAANQVHLLVGEAVEFDEYFCGAGNGGEGGGCELALEDLVDAGGQFIDGVGQAVGYAFVGAGGC